MVVTCFCNRVSTVWFVLSNSRVPAMADLRSYCGSDLIVFVFFGPLQQVMQLVSQKVERREIR